MKGNGKKLCDNCGINEGKYKSLGGGVLCKKCADDLGLVYKEELPKRKKTGLADIISIPELKEAVANLNPQSTETANEPKGFFEGIRVSFDAISGFEARLRERLEFLKSAKPNPVDESANQVVRSQIYILRLILGEVKE